MSIIADAHDGSHFLVAFRHGSDGRNPTNATGRSAPVVGAWAARQDRNRDNQLPGSVKTPEGGIKIRSPEENTHASTDEEPSDDPS